MKILLNISDFFNKNGLLILLIIFIFVFTIILLRRKDKYRNKIDENFFKSIFFKKFRLLNIE